MKAKFVRPFTFPDQTMTSLMEWSHTFGGKSMEMASALGNNVVAR
jgi:hypothetical protein